MILKDLGPIPRSRKSISRKSKVNVSNFACLCALARESAISLETSKERATERKWITSKGDQQRGERSNKRVGSNRGERITAVLAFDHDAFVDLDYRPRTADLFALVEKIPRRHISEVLVGDPVPRSHVQRHASRPQPHAQERGAER